MERLKLREWRLILQAIGQGDEAAGELPEGWEQLPGEGV